jgi:hypothetical protein
LSLPLLDFAFFSSEGAIASELLAVTRSTQ